MKIEWLVFLLLNLSIILFQKIGYLSHLILYPIFIFTLINLFDYDLEYIYILYALIGYLIAPLLTIVSFYIINKVKLPLKLTFGLRSFVAIFYEEIVFRFFLLYMLFNLLTPMLGYILSILISSLINSIIFTIWHTYSNLRDICEMILFSFILCIVTFLFPFMNVGIHLGRNVYVYMLMEEKGNELCSKEIFK